jgi:DcuC family C4-dicarboxylate transporter
LVVAKPLMKIKKPYLLASLVIIVGAVVKFAIPSSVSEVTLLLATLYPVLRKVGVSKATAASALVLSVSICWGPANAPSYFAFGIADITSMSVPQWFVQYQVPLGIIVMFAFMISFVVTSKYFDKREAALEGSSADESNIVVSGEEADPKSLGLPFYYAIFPILPLFLVIIFSDLVLGFITISVVAANFLSFFLVMIIHMINKRRFKEVFNDTQAFYEGMGSFMAKLGLILVAGTFFADVIGRIGGLTALVEIINGLGGDWVVLTAIASVLSLIVTLGTGSLTANLNIFTPLIVDIANVANGDILIMMNALIMIIGFSSPLSPVSAANIVTAETCGISIPRLLKRNVIPVIVATITTLAVVFFIGA